MKPNNKTKAITASADLDATQRLSRANQLGPCPLCQRNVSLTFHHLIPKKMHRRRYFRKTYTRHQLATGIYLCRLCHNGVHDLFDEMVLAKNLNTPALLQRNALLTKHCQWVARQRRATQ
mgnify:CR=1 FL=1